MGNSVRVPFFAHLHVFHVVEEKEPWIRGSWASHLKNIRGELNRSLLIKGQLNRSTPNSCEMFT